MAEKWWKEQDTREEVLELFGREKSIAEITDDLVKNGRAEITELTELPLYMFMDIKGTMRAAMNYIGLSYLQTGITDLELLRHYGIYAEGVQEFATSLDRLGVRTPEEVRDALPHIRRASRVVISTMPDVVKEYMTALDERVKEETPGAVVKNLLGENDAVGDTLDNLDI